MSFDDRDVLGCLNNPIDPKVLPIQQADVVLRRSRRTRMPEQPNRPEGVRLGADDRDVLGCLNNPIDPKVLPIQ